MIINSVVIIQKPEKMMKILKFTYLLGALMAFTSCGSDSDEPVDSKNPEINISKPAEEASFAFGQDIQITGEVSDDMELKEITFSLSYIGTKATKVIDPNPWAPNEEIIQLSGKSKSFNAQKILQTIPLTDIKGGNYSLKIKVSDKTDKETIKLIAITIQ